MGLCAAFVGGRRLSQTIIPPTVVGGRRLSQTIIPPTIRSPVAKIKTPLEWSGVFGIKA